MADDFDYGFEESSVPYLSGSQSARVWTENWVAAQMYCPACGGQSLRNLPNNQPVADFLCPDCTEQFELKSSKHRFGRKIVDGAYSTMIERLRSDAVPNLILLRYNAAIKCVIDITVIPKQFFVTDLIEKRKPLGVNARRAGWVGCNILIDRIPDVGCIDLVRNQVARERQSVIDKWQSTSFMRTENEQSRGWIIDVLTCIDAIEADTFTLNEVYDFESHFSQLHPQNKNIRPKIRQQLQRLRDAGLLEFLGKGRYRRIIDDN